MSQTPLRLNTLLWFFFFELTLVCCLNICSFCVSYWKKEKTEKSFKNFKNKKKSIKNINYYVFIVRNAMLKLSYALLNLYYLNCAFISISSEYFKISSFLFMFMLLHSMFPLPTLPQQQYSSVKCRQYGSWSEYAGFFHFRVCLQPSHVFLKWEMRDIIPGPPEPSTCSRSMS